jgi:tight adherence protein C
MGASITQFLENLGLAPSDLIYAAMAAAFLVVFGVTMTIARTMHGREQIRKRALHDGGEEDPLNDRRSLRHKRLAGTKQLLSDVGANFVPGNEKSVSQVRKSLMQAGFFQPSAVAWYFLLRVVLAVLSPGVAFIVIRAGGYDVAGTKLLMTLLGAATAGLLLPSLYVSHRGKRLKRQCREGFPDFMDLMVVCAEAGISLEAAIERVSREIAQNYPYLGVSLHMASLELRAGRPLIDAFQNLAGRLGIEEAHKLGSLLQQSEELGTSLSDALRVYSDEMRDKRMSVAEEKAHALPAKMAAPLTMFVFPTILIVILLPVFVRVSGM